MDIQEITIEEDGWYEIHIPGHWPKIKKLKRGEKIDVSEYTKAGIEVKVKRMKRDVREKG